MIDIEQTMEYLIIRIALSIELMIAGWILLLILDYVWSGFSKFIRLILLPGRILHVASHYLAAKIFGIRMYEVLYTGITRDTIHSGITLSSDIYGKELWKIKIMMIAPLIFGFLFAITLQKILILILLKSGVNLLTVIISWLTISFLVLGMPDIDDIKFIVTSHIIKHPEVIIGLIWSVIVFALGYITYNMGTAIMGVMIYIILLVLSSVIPRTAREEVIE